VAQTIASAFSNASTLGLCSEARLNGNAYDSIMYYTYGCQVHLLYPLPAVHVPSRSPAATRGSVDIWGSRLSRS